VASTELERRVKILDYLLKSADEKVKINKADVMRHLESTSRLNTTHRTIVDLIEEGKIKMNKENPRSQTHYLTINENNVFNKIYFELSEIENLIDRKDAFVRARYYLTDTDSDAANLLEVYLIRLFEQPIDTMIRVLLVKISTSHLSIDESDILYRKIVKLIQKQAIQPRSYHRTVEEQAKWILDHFTKTIDNVARTKDKDFQKYSKSYSKYNLDFGIKEDIIRLMENFQEKFLS